MTRTPIPSTDDIDVGTLWLAVVARKRWLLGLFLGAGLVTFAALSMMTPRYGSEARVLIEQEETSFTRPATEPGGVDRSTVVDQEAVASQVQVLLSRDLASHVVKELKLDGLPEFTDESGPFSALRALITARTRSEGARDERVLDAFLRRLTVYQVGNSRVIAVNFESRDPVLAAKAANRLAEAYLTWQQKEKLRQTRDATVWLSEQIKTLTEKVQAAEAKVEEFRSSTGLYSGTNNVTLNAQQLSELNSQLILAKAQRTEAEARAELIRKMLKEEGDVAAASDVLRSALIQRLLEQQVRVRRHLAETSATLLPSHPRIRELNSELSDLQRQIRQEANKVVKSLESEAQIAGARENSLRASLNEMKRQTGESNENQIKLRALEREAKANRDLLESYLARYRDASSRDDEASVPAHASIISRAHVANEPSFPKKLPMSLLAAAGAGMLGLAYILASELMTGGQTGRAGTGYTETIPRTPTPRNSTPHMVTGSSHTLGSAKQAARYILERCDASSAGHVVVCPDDHHAAAAQEALDIARSVAGTGASVVLLDVMSGDDDISGLTGVPRQPGAAELLSDNADFEKVVRRDSASTLHVIPAGNPRADAFSMEQLKQLGRILTTLGRIYDCIVLNASLVGARRVLAASSDDPWTVLVVSGSGTEAAQVADQLARVGPAGTQAATYLRDKAASGAAQAGGLFRRAAAI